MEGPGISLFLGSDSLQLNTSKERLEEDEEKEDLKRRTEEIDHLLTNAFDDLENDDEDDDDDDDDDDISSVNSSHYRCSAKENEHTNMTKPRLPFKMQTTTQLSNDSGAYDHVDNSLNYNHEATKNYRMESDIGLSTSDIQRDKNNKSVDGDNLTTESSYELARLPNSSYCPRDLASRAEDGYTFNDNYLHNYETPSNHYNNHDKHYVNNGYIENYGNNVQCKQIHEFGGGDNVTSEEINHRFKISPNGKVLIDDNTIYKTAEYSSKEQLEVLYTIRMKEIKQLTEELQKLEQQKETEIDQFNRKVVLLQAEVERSNISRNQAQHALIDAKAEIIDLQGQMTSLKEKNAVLETTNQNMAEELAITKDSVVDLQQKVNVLERVHALQTSDKVHEKFLKQAQEKHAVEIRNMQTQIDVLTDKFNAKEESYTALEHKLADIRRSYEALIVEKGDIVNRLGQALEKSQSQCRNLMGNNDQQMLQLQSQIKILSQEKEDMLKINQDLQNKLEVAKNESTQYDSLATTFEEESDSIRQMKLGDFHNKSRSKPIDDITNKLRGELQRCLAGQAVKRKEITRLENTLSQKEEELAKASAVAESCRQETTKYAKRVSELEQELNLVLTDEALKANAQIQKLSGHLNEVEKQYELLKKEKLNLEQKLEEAEAISQETLNKLHQETTKVQEKEFVEEYNKEYLEIHAKAVERVREEAKLEIVQLNIQLEQTQKELDHVKKLYIDVCGTKEQLINEHKEEIKMLKEKYASLEEHQKDMERLEYELKMQKKFIDKSNKDCESYKNKIIELEKDLAMEKRKKEEYTKKIHHEIERAKEEALKELRNAHPNQEISMLLPDHCSEHLQRINQLEEENVRLEERCRMAEEDHKKLSEYQTELDDTRLRIAQMEICQESWKKKYENEVTSSSTKHKLEKELYQYKDLEAKLSDQLEDLKEKVQECDNLKKRIKRLEEDLEEKNKKLNRINDLDKVTKERDLLLVKLNNQAKCFDECLKNQRQVSAELNLSPRTLGDETDLQKIREMVIKEVREEMEQKVTQELRAIETQNRDKRKEFEERYKVLLLQKEREMETLKQSLKKETEAASYAAFITKEEAVSKLIENKLKVYCEALLARKVHIEKLEEKLKQQENVIGEERNMMAQLMTGWVAEVRDIKAKEESMKDEIKKLNEMENNLRLESNALKDEIEKLKEIEKNLRLESNALKDEIEKLKETEKNLRVESEALKEREKEAKQNINMLKHKYKVAKKTGINYKEFAKKKDEFIQSEHKRLEEGYKKAITQVQKRYDEVISTYRKQMETKFRKLDSQYRERIEQMENPKQVQN